MSEPPICRPTLPPSTRIAPGALHPPPRLRVAVERERLPWSESEHVRALRLELLVRHLDDFDLALLEQVEQPHGRDTRVHEGEVTVEWGHERHEVQDLAAPVPMREVELDHVDTRERVGERSD